jgi:transmembrane sensor
LTKKYKELIYTPITRKAMKFTDKNTNVDNLKTPGKETTEEKIMRITASYSVPEKTSKKDALENILRKTSDNTIHLHPKKRNYNYFVAIAASVVVLIGVGYFWAMAQTTTVKVDLGHHLAYTLPDGSVATLNAGSQISFKKYGFQSDRKVNLNGEAFFEVKKGSKFDVITKNGNVQVLGTSFNVFSRNELFKVSCLTGKVKVSIAAASEIITPGESVEKKANILAKIRDENIKVSASWRNGEFNFVDTSLKSIFEEIERQFNVTVKGIDLESYRQTCDFTNKNLTEALDIICIPMQLEYEVKPDNTVVVYKQKK